MKKRTGIRRWAALGLCLALLLPSVGVAWAQDAPVALVRDPQTAMTVPTGLVTPVRDAKTLEGIREQSPSVAILWVDSTLQVTDPAGKQVISTVDQVFDQFQRTIVPAFYIKDADTVKALNAYFQEHNIADAMAIATEPAVFDAIRETESKLIAAVDYTGEYGGLKAEDITDEVVREIREATTARRATLAILPETFAQKDILQYLQSRYISVWLEQRGKLTGRTQAMNLLTAGANGVVSDNRALLEDCLSAFPAGTLLRRVSITGHRGGPSLAPENTLPAFLMGYEAGADRLECDVWISKDGELVVIHDNSGLRTAGAAGSIEQSTLAQIKQLTPNLQFADDPRFRDVEIPTLRELLEAFKGKDVILYVEIKTNDVTLAEKLQALVEEYDMSDQVMTIAFSGGQIMIQQKTAPEYAAGFLVKDQFDANQDLVDALQKTLRWASRYGVTVHPPYNNCNDDYYRQTNYRGLIQQNFTFRKQNLFDEYFVKGIASLSTDYPQWAGDYASNFFADGDSAYTLEKDGSVQLSAHTVLYNRTTRDVTDQMKIVPIEGEELLHIQGNQVTATGAGTASVMLQYTGKTVSGNEYVLYTQPITITVKGGMPSGLFWVIGGVVLAAVAVAAVAVVTSKKKKS